MARVPISPCDGAAEESILPPDFPLYANFRVGLRTRLLPCQAAAHKEFTTFMMYLEQLDHIALRCASLETTKNWYVDTLGFEHVFLDHGGGVPVILRLGSTFITLFPWKQNEPPAPNGQAWHLALRAATYAGFVSAQTELQNRGVSFQFRDHEIAHSIYFSDPDGFVLEITTYDLPKPESGAKTA